MRVNTLNITSTPIPLAMVDDTKRLRLVDPAWVEGLAVSMEEIGLNNPIEVGEPGENGLYPLISGAHRLHAARLLEWETIPAVIFTGDAVVAAIREIDENLMRRELSILDRGVFLAERKKLHLLRFPQTAHGGDRVSEQAITVLGCSGRFSEEVAKKIGLSAATVDRGVKVIKIVPDVRETIARTWLADSWADLKLLTTLPPEKQRGTVKRVLRANNPLPSIAAALRDLDGDAAPVPDNDEQQFRALRTAWRKASAAARKRFLAHLRETEAMDAAA